MRSKLIVGVVGFVLAIVLIYGFGGQQAGDLRISAVATDETGGGPLGAGTAGVAWASGDPKSMSISPLYQKEIQPLTAIECARCHPSVFQAIKKAGFRHQIECVRCHREFHVYNPRKQNYDEIMPKCIWCHQSATGGPFHGDDPSVTPCLRCHGDPHKPLDITVSMSEIETVCADCHTKEGGEIAKYVSRHTTLVTCADCHADRHGYIPECSECHENHSPQVEMATKDCMACHPVHKPLEITYTEATPSTLCAGCHKQAYNLLQQKTTRHTPVACVDCHPSHKEIPPCSRCHGEPHPKGMNATDCGSCHGIAHDLLT